MRASRRRFVGRATFRGWATSVCWRSVASAGARPRIEVSGAMATYLVRRLVYSVFVLVGLMVVVFVVTRMLGDAARLMLPIEAPEAQYLALRQKLGLDQPLYVQLIQYMLQQARGDFGTSLWQGVPAMQLVLSRFPATLYLATSAISFSFLIALPI